MTRYAPLCAALLLAVPAAAQETVQPADPLAPAPAASGEPAPSLLDPRVSPQDFDVARKKVVDCEGEKFVFAWGAGARPTKVTLCSKKDATADELVQMLEDAAAKLEKSSMAEDRRVAIVQQIRSKISELKGGKSAAPAAAAVAEPLAKLPEAALVLPVIPAPVPAPEPVARPPIAPVFTPTPVPARTPSLLAAKPRLTFECYTPGDIGTGGPCITLARDTRLTVKAGEPLAGGTTLRFRRNGEIRAELALNQMRKGQSVRLVIPQQVCGGVVEAEVEIQVARGGSTVDTRGPYLLRC